MWVSTCTFLSFFPAVRSGRDRGGGERHTSRDESSRGSKSATGSRSHQPSSKNAPPIRIKKEKTSDDERRKKKRDASSESDSR